MTQKPNELNQDKLYLGVIGRPILQSLSPIIHSTALEHIGRKGAFLRIAATSIEEGVLTARQIGLRGFNVTAPFKEDAWKESKVLDEDAQHSKAVNAILLGESLSGFNTDIFGILESLGLYRSRVEGKTALVIGAGGAAKAAVSALKQVGCRVFITNRTEERAEVIANEFGVHTVKFKEAEDILKVTDYIVNTVVWPDVLFKLDNVQSHTLILDAIYAKETPLSQALSSNPNYISGKNWLLHQGLRAFEIFSGHKLTELQFTEVRKKLESIQRSAAPTISLIGMMGSGKSSVASSLGAILSRDIVNLDDIVEQIAGCSIPQLVKEKGELAFREIESEALEKALKSKPRVLSCGGGIIGTERNRHLLSTQTTPVWLWATKEELAKRLVRFQNRPLLHGHDLLTRVGQLLEDRFYDYAKTCELVVQTGDKTPSEIAKQVAFEVSNAF
jgi:shikimate dehydrogenase